MVILCGLTGIPPSNGVIPQSPMHTKSLATLKHQDMEMGFSASFADEREIFDGGDHQKPRRDKTSVQCESKRMQRKYTFSLPHSYSQSSTYSLLHFHLFACSFFVVDW
ncbi:hypothetical protein POM88_015593 [Heracleum sosnowskyi]|uniref:Uncharacterized protein n=1 Tax=Heracleum sosnowskyi TaxID=360622 RepID=A0AAD8IP11_9APIA|nr:hypothetical protein POM88_015593 [Heracleum sosnowskyi]